MIRDDFSDTSRPGTPQVNPRRKPRRLSYKTDLSKSQPGATQRRQSLLDMALNLERDEMTLSPPPPKSKLFQGYTVEMTPSGSLRTAETLNLEQTPHGSIRRQKFPPVPMLLGALEKVAAADVEEEDVEETLSQHGAHINRWLLGPAPSNSPPTILPARSSPQPGPSGVAARVEHQTPARGSDMDSDYDDVFDTNVDFTSSRIERDIPDDTAEFGVQLQEAIEEMEEEMDRCQDNLLGSNNVFNWSEDFSTFTGTRDTFIGTPGPTKDFPEVDSAFTAIWDIEIMSRIAEETNRYAEQVIQTQVLSRKSRLQYWTPTNFEELYRLFAIFIFMGMDPRTKQSEYWMTSTVLAMPGFRKLMSFNRFILLTKFLHFVDNNDERQNALQSEGKFLSPKLYKLSPVIHHLNKKFSELYSLEENLSIDESLTLFKGRLSWIQAIRSKSARFGMKSFELCESRTGYMYRFQIYTGKSHTSNVDSNVVSISSDLGGKTTKIVLELIEGLEGKGHCLTMDNFYNSPALARHLKSKGIDCLGTLRANRKHVPEAINKLKKNVPRGTIVAQHSGDVSVLAWKDVKIVNMISTFHDKTTVEGTRAGNSLQKPTSVRDYNFSMGGIDLKDQMLSMYLMERKRCLKWYIKLFKRLLNVSVLNSYIMCNKSRESSPELNLEAIDHRTYRYELAERLSRIGRIEISRPVPADDINVTRLRRDIPHNPVMSRGRKMNRRRCARCGAKGIEKRVLSACTVCNVGLCFGTECWKDYHSLEHLK